MFWDKGGSTPGGDFKKIFRAPPPGGEKFFSVGCLFSRPGGDFAQKSQKMASPGGQKFFSPGCEAPRGAPPPVFFAPGVGQIFGLRGGGTPHSGLHRMEIKKILLHFWVLLDLTRWEIGIKSGPERSNMPRIGFEVRYLRPYFHRFI